MKTSHRLALSLFAAVLALAFVAASRQEGDLVVTGRLTAGHISYPSNEISNAAIASDAGIDAEKLEHQYCKSYSQPNTTATAETRILHVVHGDTAEVLEFEAGSIVANVGAATVTVDLKKNGTTILSAVITLDNTNTAYVTEAGTISSANLVDGDVLTIVTTATAGGGTIATGFFCSVKLREKAD